MSPVELYYVGDFLLWPIFLLYDYACFNSIRFTHSLACFHPIGRIPFLAYFPQRGLIPPVLFSNYRLVLSVAFSSYRNTPSRGLVSSDRIYSFCGLCNGMYSCSCLFSLVGLLLLWLVFSCSTYSFSRLFFSYRTYSF